MMRIAIWVAAAAAAAWLLLAAVECDINADRSKCGEKLMGLATCLAYVSGQSKVPTADCCGGLKEVVQDNPGCICVLINDRNDPSLSLNINATLAMHLPERCKVYSKYSANDCIAYLHLDPNSPDAQIFKEVSSVTPHAIVPSPAPTGSARSTGVPTTVVQHPSSTSAASRNLLRAAVAAAGIALAASLL